MAIIIGDGFDNESIRRGLAYLKMIELSQYINTSNDYMDWLTRVVAYNFYIACKKYSFDDHVVLTTNIIKSTFSGSMLRAKYTKSTLADTIKYALLWEK